MVRTCFFTALATPCERYLGSREWWSDLLTVRGNSWPGNQVPGAQLSSRRQTTGYCLLLSPADISRYSSGLSTHVAMLKWFNTVQQQGRLSCFRVVVNLQHESVLKCLLHSRLIFSECRNISFGDADCFLRTQLKHSQAVKQSRRIQCMELSLLI